MGLRLQKPPRPCYGSGKRVLRKRLRMVQTTKWFKVELHHELIVGYAADLTRIKII